MSLYKYTPYCKLSDLFEGPDNRELAERLTNTIHTVKPNDHVILYSGDDFDDPCAYVEAVVISDRDCDPTIVLIDDCDHINVIRSKRDISRCGFKDTHIGIPTEFNDKLNKVFAKYKRHGSMDYFEMAKRLVELGDVDK